MRLYAMRLFYERVVSRLAKGMFGRVYLLKSIVRLSTTSGI